jgi:hypothetical protein
MPIQDLSGTPLFTAFPAEYYYQLISSNGLSLTVLRDEGVPKITDGVGGWTVKERRRRKGLTSWTGRNPWRMELPVIFEGKFDPLVSVDADVGKLNAMAIGDNFVIPPTVTVEGNVPIKGATWVIEDLAWGDNQEWAKDPSAQWIRVRQDCVIKLLQYVEEDVVKILNTNPTPKTLTVGASTGTAGVNTPDPGDLSANCAKDLYNYQIGKYSRPNLIKRWKEHNCPGDPPTNQTSVKHAGATLRSIAGLEYDDPSKWTDIADANPNLPRDPNAKIPIGTTVIIPQVTKKK